MMRPTENACVECGTNVNPGEPHYILAVWPPGQPPRAKARDKVQYRRIHANCNAKRQKQLDAPAPIAPDNPLLKANAG